MSSSKPTPSSDLPRNSILPAIDRDYRSSSRYQYIHPGLPPIPPTSQSYVPPRDKLYEVEIKVEEVRNSLKQGIDKAIDRGEKLEDMEIKAKNLSDSSLRFHEGSKNLKWMLCKQNAKLIGCCLFVLAVIIFIVVMIAQSNKN